MERWTLVFFQNGTAGIGGPAKMFTLNAEDWKDARKQARELFRGDFEPGKTRCPYHNQELYLTHMLLISELHDTYAGLLKEWQQEIELEEEALVADLPELTLAVCQPWVMMERGSAPEHDRYSLHVDEDERDFYEKQYIKKNHPPGRAPDCYAQPDGNSYLVAVDKMTHLKLHREGSLMVYSRPPNPFELRSKKEVS